MIKKDLPYNLGLTVKFSSTLANVSLSQIEGARGHSPSKKFVKCPLS